MELESKEWWVYQGDKTLDDVAKHIPPWRQKALKSDEENGGEEKDKFIPLDQELVEAVNASIYLRRPLLVTGEPGIGKSSLAKSIAKQLDTEFLHWQITSKSVLKDALYSYDALARLHDIQMKNLYHNLKEHDEEIKAYKNIPTGIENYLKLTALGSAFVSPKPVVLLIDEIDKSDIDLPNDLLHIFEEQEFEIDELKRMKFDKSNEPKIDNMLNDYNAEAIPNGKVVCKNFPIIIMTSNGEQEFPPAFLRRCISVEMKLGKGKEAEQLTKIVESHFPDKKGDTHIESIIVEFVKLKSEGLRSNDQLLNALFLVLDVSADFEAFKREVLKSIG